MPCTSRCRPIDTSVTLKNASAPKCECIAAGWRWASRIHTPRRLPKFGWQPPESFVVSALPTPGTKIRNLSRTRPFSAVDRYFLDCSTPQRQPFYHCPGKGQRIPAKCERIPWKHSFCAAWSVQLGRCAAGRAIGPERPSRSSQRLGTTDEKLILAMAYLSGRRRRK